MPRSKETGGRPGSLETYKRKRDFNITPEPSGKKTAAAKRLRFVVQMHRATRLHYDFRLEADGVLASWAVPKGPTLAPLDRRLAMHVEDHPMDYRDFEGNIPAGQYGAGNVIVWDKGTYRLAEGDDPAAEIAGGKIKFVLDGKKLKGEFTLVRIKGREGEHGDPWLLIKDRDQHDDPKYDPADHPQSVKSGKTLDDVAADPRSKIWNSREKSSHATAPKRAPRVKRDPLPRLKSVMLATLIDRPFDDDAWLWEVKWDGYRAICTVDEEGALSLVSRNGLDLLQRFPAIAELAEAFTSVPIVVDGEIVSLDAQGRSDFQRLQEAQRDGSPLAFAAFDLLYADGRDLRKRPLEERKALLERSIRDDSLALYSKHIVGKGTALFEIAGRERLEGIVGKRRASAYQERRSRDWVKVKAQLRQEFVIGGWTDPQGSRKGFGALLLGAYEGGSLRYVGSVGTGFSHAVLAGLHATLQKIGRKTSPFGTPVAGVSGPHWVKPELVVEVRFTEWTRDKQLRHPAYLGPRFDKDASSVTLELPLHRKPS
ncbi:MAG TPA: non-homologous end-joining DNA ligase [Candidatus Tumulicola sp.]|nr:non-homologous end-joining DNA ligase [Candidatus Tumulicola sp.]